jgi:3-dehydroquinate dehydratase-1
MTSDLPTGPAVVGTIHSSAALREALRLRKGEVDLLEVRIDHFVTNLKALAKALPKLTFPLIITVRHPKEGGAVALSAAERMALYRQFLPSAALIDVELRSAGGFRPLLEEARSGKVSRILSWHDFRSTPSLASLQSRWTTAAGFGPEVIKFATATKKPAHLATLIALLGGCPARPATSLMGMQELGKVSRLTLAAAGSRLNYGYLGEPQVSGQWPARLLKQRLAELAV